MQVIKTLFRVCLLIFPAVVFGQGTYIRLGDKAYDLLDRLEIKTSNNNKFNFSVVKPYNREFVINQVRNYFKDSNNTNRSPIVFSPVDQNDIHSLYLNNYEWVSDLPSSNSKPRLGKLFVNPSNLIQVKNKDFFLAVNPVIDFQKSFGSEIDKGAFINSKGIEARGMIANKIGFSTLLTDNQEQGPAYFNDRVNNFNQVPGIGFWKRFKTTGFDYFDARGYITFKAAKLIDVQFGYDNNFVGAGYRSLFLSNYSNSYLFLKLNLKKGKFEYQTLFTELMPSYIKSGDTLLDRKYASFYHLGYNATRWLNIGLFEGVVFGNKNDFGIKNLNPIIFFRHLQGFSNSLDNAIAGVDIKANFAHHFQLYGQLLLDEFDFSQLSKNNGYWANKTGYQVGLKYIDAFTISNLDLQLETNKVRPFSYAYSNPIANYTHYNLPLAHPLGGNFQEYILIAKYHPFNKWRIDATIVNYQQGLDSAGVNFGSNPFSNTLSRQKDYGYSIKSGNMATVLNANFNLSYELLENLFIEGGALLRTYHTQQSPASVSDKIISLGIRWNLQRRHYDL